MERTDTVGDADPGVGILLVSVGAIAGLIGGVVGLAATPKPEDKTPSD